MKKNHSFLSYYILEIKWRIFYFLISFGFTFLLSCYFSKILLFYITDPAIIMKDCTIIVECLNNPSDILLTNCIPFNKEKLIYTDMSEGMLNTIETCLFFTSLFCSIYFFYNIWAFLISSTLYSEIWKINCFISFFILSILNSWFISFHIILPFSWKFFTSFQLITETISINCEPRFKSYCFFLYWIFLFSFFFHILFCCFFLSIYLKKLKIIHFPSTRKIPLFLFLLFSAIISPPDLLSQLVVFIIIWSIFEFLYLFTFYITCRTKNY